LRDQSGNSPSRERTRLTLPPFIIVMNVGVATPKFCYPSVPYPPSGPAGLAQSRMDRDLPPLPSPLGRPRRVSFAAQPELHEDESERRRAERALRRQSRQQRDLEIAEREQRLDRLAQQLPPSRSECRLAGPRRSSDTVSGLSMENMLIEETRRPTSGCTDPSSFAICATKVYVRAEYTGYRSHWARESQAVQSARSDWDHTSD